MAETLSRIRRARARLGLGGLVAVGLQRGASVTRNHLPGRLSDGARLRDQDFAFLSADLLQVSEADLKASRFAQKPRTGPPRTCTWFVPHFEHGAYGGVSTIFRFMQAWSTKGLRSRVVLYDSPAGDADRIERDIRALFPDLGPVEFTVLRHTDEIAVLPRTDMGVATMWPSAYVLLRFNQCDAKYYFVQDYEPLFYEAGSVSALAQSTYRFGFKVIANTPGLLSHLESQHDLEGTSFTPAVDSSRYYPPASGASAARRKVRIFFYARPSNPRNAFLLGVQVIRDLLDRYPDALDIVVAGAGWDEAKYGLRGKISNLGRLPTSEAVGDLYRSCDIGFVYMLTKHPSYQPFEFMASGMATVTNRNESNLWFLKDGKNCLLSEPSPRAMADTIGRLVDDPGLRRSIAEAGVAAVGGRAWTAVEDETWEFISGCS